MATCNYSENPEYKGGKMSVMTNEIKCYICMISCIFIKLIFMVVYTEWMYY